MSAVISINLSGQPLCREGFLEFVIGQLERTGVKPSWIRVELTEMTR